MQPDRQAPGATEPTRRTGRIRRKSFVERTIAGLAATMERSLYAEQLATNQGLLQQLDPRVKVVGLLALIVTTALAQRLSVIVAAFAVALVLAVLSRVPFRILATRVWLSVLAFTGLIALPAIFITPGRVIYRLPLVAWPITEQGLRSATYLITRVETTATFALLLILCTPWTHVLKALRVLRMPTVIVVILGMTYRYIFVLLQTALDMFEARQSRLVGTLPGPERRRLATNSVGVLLSKTFQLSNDVFLAMQARGFRGEVYLLDEFAMQRRDWLALGLFLALAGGGVWLGR